MCLSTLIRDLEGLGCPALGLLPPAVIALGGADRLMPRHRCNGGNVYPGVQQVRHERAAQIVGGEGWQPGGMGAAIQPCMAYTLMLYCIQTYVSCMHAQEGNMGPRIAIANHKGGVGKTTTTHALGATFAKKGLTVLMVDLDPQSSLTEACGVYDAEGQSMAEVLGGSSPGHKRLFSITRQLGERLYLAPSTIEMARAQRDIASRITGRETAVKRALNSLDGIDIVLMDCPPSLDMLTLNGLVAATHVIIPSKPQIVDLRGLRLFLDTLDQIEDSNPDLTRLGILLTFWERVNHHRDALELLQSDPDLHVPVFHTKIGKSIRVAEGPAQGESIIDYSPANPRAEEYQALAEEVLECLKTS